MKRNTTFVSGIFAAILFLGWAAARPAAGQTPPGLMSFQGRLTDASNNPLSGPHDFAFSIYNALSGGTQLWGETQNGVTVANGVLAAQLGSGSAIPASVFNEPAVYLQITVDGVTLAPRQRLITSPYAFNSAGLSGRAYTAFVSTDSAPQTIAGNKTFTGDLSAVAGLSAPNLRLAGNVVISSETIASLGAGVRISTNVYIVGFSSAAKYYGDGSALTGVAGSDDLGNHTAAQALNMNSNQIVNVSSLTVIGKDAASGYSLSLSSGLNMPAGTVNAGRFVGDGRGLYNLLVSSVAAGAINTAAHVADAVMPLAKLHQSGCANNQVPKWNGSAWACGDDNSGTAYTADETSLHLAGGVFSAIGSSVTLQGNSFNAPDKLVRLDGLGYLPALDGSALTNVNSARFAAVAADTTTIAVNLAAEAGARGGGDSALGASTGTLRSDLNAVISSTAPLANAGNWNTAYGWGDHALAGYSKLESTQTFSGQNNFQHLVTVSSDLLVMNGNVGIGTVAAGYKLEVNGTIHNGAGPGDVLLSSNGWGEFDGAPLLHGGIQFSNSFGLKNWIGASNGSTQLQFGSGSTVGMALQSGILILPAAGGQLGVGTSSPAGKVDVQANGSAPSDMAQIWRDSSGAVVSSVSATGVLMAAKFVGDGSGLTGIGSGGDDLGNHVATTTLQMGAYGVNTSSDITAARYQIAGSTVLALSGNSANSSSSIGLGPNAGMFNTGNFNVFIGSATGASNTAGAGNTMVGAAAGKMNVTGNTNAFMGRSSGYSNVSGTGNVYVGNSAGYYGQTGSANVVIGPTAGLGVSGSSFSSSTLVGYQAGYNLGSGSNNIIIGYAQWAPAADISNFMNIGGVLYGDLANGRIGIGTMTPTGLLDVYGRTLMRGAFGGDNFGQLVIGDADNRGGITLWNGTSEQLGYLRFETAGSNLLTLGSAGGSGQLSLATGGADQVRITAAGNVGISTGAPQARLDVLAAGSAQTDMAQIWRDSSGAVVSSVSATGVLMAAKFVGDGSGLTGIGGSLSGGQAPRLSYWTTGNTLGNSVLSQDSAASLTAMNSTFTVQGSAFSVGGSTLVVMNGNVGVGTSNPGARFEVAGGSSTFMGSGGDSAIAGFADADGNYKLWVSTIGKIGVGTTVPRGTLSVVASTPSIVISNSSARAINAKERLVFSLDAAQNEHAAIEAVNLSGGTGYSALTFNTYGPSGYERMRITESGNVGIGTISPSQKLVVQESVEGNIARFIGNSSSMYFQSEPNHFSLYSYTAASSAKNMNLSAQGGGAVQVYLKTDGSVGVGTDSPTARLHIGGTPGVDGIRFPDGTLMTSAGVGSASGAANAVDLTLNADSDANGSGALHLQTGGSDKITVLNGGNVGIGTVAPGSRLTVAASAAYDGMLVTNSNRQSTTFRSTGEHSMVNIDSAHSNLLLPFLNFQRLGVTYGLVQLNRASSSDALGPFAESEMLLGSVTATPLSLQTDSTRRLVVTSTGNIGIGTAAPAQKVHIFADATAGQVDPYIQVEKTHPSVYSTRYLTKYGSVGLDSVLPAGTSLGYEIKVTGGDQGAGGGGIAFKTNGDNTRVFVQQDGNVGVGTSGPSRKLHVYSTNGMNTLLENNGTGNVVLEMKSAQNASRSINFLDSAGSAVSQIGVWGASNGVSSMTFNTSGVTRMKIDENGNVGIGTGVPSELLMVGNSATGANKIAVVNTSGGVGDWAELAVRNGLAPNDALRLQVTGSGYTSNGAFVQDSGLVHSGSNLSGGLSLVASAVSPMRFYTGGYGDVNERMRIDGAGNVGIGTAGPGAILHVNDANGTIGLLKLSGKTSGAVSHTIQNAAGIDNWQVNVGADGYSIIDGSQSSYRMLINNAGNIGIGTTSPAYKLDVNGAVNATSVLINGVAVGAGGTQWASGAGGVISYTGGNVGIGTANPGNPLSVQSAAAILNVDIGSALQTSYSNLILRSDTGNSQIWKQGSGLATWGGVRSLNLYNSEDYPIAFFQGVSERMRINNGGSVGIGTKSPAANLHISSTTATASQDMLRITTGTANADAFVVKGNGKVGVGTTSPVTALQLMTAPGAYGFGHTDGTIDLRTQVTGGAGWLGTSSNHPLNFYTNSSGARMTIDNAGNVGIGTTSPGYRTHVYQDMADQAANVPVMYIGAGGTAAVTKGSVLELYSARGSGTIDVDLLKVGTSEGTKFTIRNDGNVGISTGTPAYKLDVNGDVNLAAGSVYRIGGVAQSGTSKWTAGSGNDIYRSLGNVGIGTVSPGQRLHVSGTGVELVKAETTDNTDQSISGFSAYSDSSYITMGSHASARTISRYGLTLGGWTEISDFNNTGTSNGFVLGTSMAAPLVLGTNNLERVRVDSSGRVGIGTTGPGARLQIDNASATNLNALLINQLDTGYFAQDVVAAGAGLRIRPSGTPPAANHMLAVGTGVGANSGNLFNVQFGGNVGVGTANPQGRLHVETSDTSGSYVFMTSHSVAGLGLAVSTDSRVGVGAASPRYKLEVAGNVGIFQSSNDDKGGLVVTSQDGYSRAVRLWAGNDGTSRVDSGLGGAGVLVLNSGGGNVGIGTPSPLATLSVHRPIPAAVSVANASLYMRGSDNGYGLAMGNLTGGYTWIQGMINDAPSLPLLLNPSGGNVGIGTASPGAKLDVTQTADSPTLKLFSNQSGYLSSNQSVLQLVTTNGTSNPTASYALTATYNGANLLHVRNDGNVGIGTAAPAERLDLGGGNVKMGYELVTTAVPSGSAIGWYYATCPAGKYSIGGACATGSGTAPTNTDITGTAYGCYKSDFSTNWQVKAVCANMR